MNIFQFMNDSPFLTFFLGTALINGVYSIVKLIVMRTQKEET